MKSIRVLTSVVFIAIVAMLFTSAFIAIPESIGQSCYCIEELYPTAKVAQCQEDMPCWDCATMGNKVCGPQ